MLGPDEVQASTLDEGRVKENALRGTVIPMPTEGPTWEEAIAMEDSTFNKDFSGATAVLIGDHAARLGIPFEEASENLEEFARLTGLAENSGKTVGGNRTSSAKGLYQFVDGSVNPAINRLEKYIGMQDWMKEAKKHKDANRLTREQQTLLFLGDMLEKKGSDALMKKVMSGDKEAMKMAYRKLHHTNMKDKKTKALADRIFK